MRYAVLIDGVFRIIDAESNEDVKNKMKAEGEYTSIAMIPLSDEDSGEWAEKVLKKQTTCSETGWSYTPVDERVTISVGGSVIGLTYQDLKELFENIRNAHDLNIGVTQNIRL